MISKLADIKEESIELINESLASVVHRITLPIAVELAMDILGRIYPGSSGEKLYDMILFKTDPNISFPKSDIGKMEFLLNDGRIRVEITVNFLGIFGASSPLPMHYNEKVLEDSQNERVLIDFLDMLNHRLKKLLYPIWVKQRYYIQYRPDLSDRFSKYMLSMLGLYSSGETIPSGLQLHKLLPFVGILSMHRRPGSTMATVLQHYFEHDSVTIEEGILSRAHIPEYQHVSLGDMNSTLGEDMNIGLFVTTRSLKFRIVFNDISRDDLLRFSAKGTAREELETLIRFIQKAPLDFDICVTIRRERIEKATLGESGCILGVDTWIGSVKDEQAITL